MADKQATSPWVWIFLILVLASFVAFILFLDQKIVKSSANRSVDPVSTESETKPVIDFYKVLPEREVEITISEEDQEGIENPSINKKASQTSILQAGSFKSSGDADGLKAQLAFLGLRSSVKTADVDGVTWYRVQLGPFESNSQLSNARNLLIENNIRYIQLSLSE